MTLATPWHTEEDALWRRAEAQAASNVYQRDFYRFLTECCWTVDEAAGGEFALFPADEYIRELCAILMVENLTLLEKTRRVRATWLCSALEVWVCAGGQDPRWPALMKSTGYRQCIVISKKERDADYVISKRIKPIYQQLVARGIGEKWPGFPTCRFSYTEANWSNGSQVLALPQGPDQVRQYGATLLRYEEFAHSPDAQDTVGAALPLLQGKDGGGGHFIGVCTPNADSFARDIRDDEANPVFGGPEVRAVDWPALRTEQDAAHRKYVDLTMKHLRAPAPGRMLPYWHTRAGWCVVQVPWLAVPGYDIKKAMKGQVKEQDKRREYTLDWDAATGKLIFPEFTPHVHVADHILPFYPGEPLQVGWDLPGHPACVISQMNPQGQWCILSSVSPEEEESIGVYEFGQRVANHLLKCYAAPNGLALDELQIHHYGDPTGWKLIPRPGEAPQEARSCYDILDRGVRLITGHGPDGEPIYEEREGFGFRVQPGEVGITARWEALRAWLDKMVRGEPAFVVCQSAKAVTKALSSYQYRELAEGRYSNEALKNWPSHTCLPADVLVETSRGHVSIADVRVGDWAMTRRGWKRVLAAACMGVKSVVEVSFDDGTTLRATGDHPVWVNGQWIQAKELKHGDVCDARLSPSRGRFTRDTQTLSTSPTRCISRGELGDTLGDCIGTSGRLPTVLSLKGATSTIGTVTLSTTRWRTWSALLKPSMQKPMRRLGRTTRLPCWRIWSECAPWRQNGIALKRGGNGIASTLSRCLSALARRGFWCASGAGTATWLAPVIIGTSSVAESATPPSAERLELMTSNAPVRAAANPLLSTDTQGRASAPLGVVGVTMLPGAVPVYDLTVDEAHEFYANGVLVKNCDGLCYVATRLNTAAPKRERRRTTQPVTSHAATSRGRR